MRKEIEQAEKENRLGRFIIRRGMFREQPGAIYDLFRQVLPIRMRDDNSRYEMEGVEIQAFGMGFASMEKGEKIPSYKVMIHKYEDGSITVEWEPCRDLSI